MMNNHPSFLSISDYHINKIYTFNQNLNKYIADFKPHETP